MRTKMNRFDWRNALWLTAAFLLMGLAMNLERYFL